MAADRRHPEAIAAFGVLLRTIRKANGMSQDDLARVCDLHVTEISRLERGRVDPRLSTVIEAANGLGVAPARLLAFPE